MTSHTHYTEPVTHKAGHLDEPDLAAENCPVCQELVTDRARRIFTAARIVRDSHQLQYRTPGGQAHALDPTFERAAVALAYVDEVGVEYATAEDLNDRYQGVWADFGEFVDDLIESTDMLHGVPEAVARYFDTEKFGRDLLLGGDYSTADLDNGSYQIVVFSCG